MSNTLYIICCWVEDIGSFPNYYSSESMEYLGKLIHLIRITSILLKILTRLKYDFNLVIEKMAYVSGAKNCCSDSLSGNCW